MGAGAWKDKEVGEGSGKLEYCAQIYAHVINCTLRLLGVAPFTSGVRRSVCVLNEDTVALYHPIPYNSIC
jgi:hypothetical protein